MANDLLNRGYASTSPTDSLDPPRFGSLRENVKDAFKIELEKFFTRAQQTSARRSEIPTIEKYAIMATGLSPYETALEVVRKYPDTLTRLPHVAVLATSGQEIPLSVGPPLLGAVQEPPRIVALRPGPYTLQDGDTLVVRTKPKGVVQTSNLVFSAGRFLDIAGATAAEVAQAINEQALYVFARSVTIGGQEYLQIETGGPYGKGTPNEIEVLPASTANVLTQTEFGKSFSGSQIDAVSKPILRAITGIGGNFLPTDAGKYITVTGSSNSYFNDGRFPISDVISSTQLRYENKYGISEPSFTGTFFIGERDDSTNNARVPKNRFAYLWDVDVQIHVITDDDIVRDETADLVTSFFTFFAEQKFFTLLGRSTLDPTIAGEHYQISFKRDMRSTSESEVPRGESGKDKAYVDTYSFGCSVSQYIDRDVRVQSGPHEGEGWTIEGDEVELDETLPMPS